MSNQTLDGILRKVDIHKSIASPDGNPFIPGNISVEEAAAAIQKLVKEVIGLHDGQQLAPRTMKPYKNQRNRDAKVRDSLRVEQRQRAKERGLL